MRDCLVRFAVIAAVAAAAAGCGGYSASKSSSITITPKVAALAKDASTSFSYTLETSGSTDVVWSVTGGSITQTGVYKAPSFEGVFDVTLASIADPDLKAQAVVAVGTDNGGTVEPATLSLGVGETFPLTVTFTGLADNTAEFFATKGKVEKTGANAATYTAPDDPTSASVFARSTVNKSLFGKRVIDVKAIAIALAPNGLEVAPNAVQTFTATVTGPRNTDVTWTASAGTIDAAGNWTAPAATGVYTVTATSKANTTKTGSATVIVR